MDAYVVNRVHGMKKYYIGKRKTEALAEILREINPFCEIVTHDVRVDEKNCLEIFGECPIVCEAFDGSE